MSIALLVLGAVTTVTGLALVGLTVGGRGGANVDITLVMPGTVVIVGGLVLVGLGLAVRELRRIERMLAARQVVPAARAREAPETAKIEPPVAPQHIPFAPQSRGELHPPPTPASEDSGTESTQVAASEHRPENPQLTAAVGEADFSQVLLAPGSMAEDHSEDRKVSTAGRANGSPAGGVPFPRLEADARPPRVGERSRESPFDAFWPKGERPRREAKPGPQPAAPPAPPQVRSPLPPPHAAVPAQGSEATAGAHPAAREPRSMAADGRAPAGEPRFTIPNPRPATPNPRPATPNPRPAAAASAAPAPRSILKSGVVEGMAYTLYSDGSIDAQMPQGMVRFSSIAELRAHVEKES